jgi:hypothetical protein
MEARIHQVASRRSFTRSLSIVAVAVVAFAALELSFAQPTLAGIVCCSKNSNGTTNTNDCLCDSSLVCNITRNSKLYNAQLTGKTCWNYSSYGSSSQITSTITCDAINGIGTVDFTQASLLGTATLDATSFTQSALLSCAVTDSSIPSHNDTGLCQFDLTYSRAAGLTTCAPVEGGNFKLTYQAFCSQVKTTGNTPSDQQLTVNGTLNCGATLNPGPGNLPGFCDDPNCILNLGIAEQAGKCSDLFPADSELAEDQVLSFSQTIEGPDPGPSCGLDSGTERKVVAIDGPHVRYCTGGTFNGAPVDCTPPSNQPQLTGTGTGESAVPFDVTFSPTKLNVTCQNNDVWRFTIFGNQHLDVTLLQVSPMSLMVEGFSGVTCDAPVGNNLSCAISACQAQQGGPLDGQKLGSYVDARDVNHKFVLTVTGTLQSGTPIIGEQTVTTSGGKL